MNRLKNAHRGERAVIIFGGPSIIEQGFDFGKLRDRDYVVFLESEALTPWFLSSGVTPDYYLMLFPEKCKDNSLHNFIFRSFLASSNIRRSLKRQHLPVLEEMETHFDEYFEPWRPHKGAHKNYRWKKDVYLKDSPFDLIHRLPNTKIIANRKLMEDHFPDFLGSDQLYFFQQDEAQREFDLDLYYHPREIDGEVTLYPTPFLNSAAIALYPLLYYMGFRDIYFLGMDMSMLGSFEYAANYTFKSMLHFWWYFRKTKQVFNARYITNRPYYLRPPSEFKDLSMLLHYENIRFTRVYDPFKYAAAVDGISTVSLQSFLND